MGSVRPVRIIEDILCHSCACLLIVSNISHLCQPTNFLSPIIFLKVFCVYFQITAEPFAKRPAEFPAPDLLTSRLQDEDTKPGGHSHSYENHDNVRCSSCFQTFSVEEELRAHNCVASVSQLSSSSNAQCDLRDADSHALTAEGMFCCSYCGIRFENIQNLKQHSRQHFNERPFKCNFCSKSFTWKHMLKTHERTHTGERPYPCKYCGKLFRRTTAVTAHERIHTGEKPYVCRFCGKAFGDPSNLRSHERRLHIHHLAVKT